MCGLGEWTKGTEPGAWQTTSLTDIIHPRIKRRERNVIKCLTVMGQGSGLGAGMQNLCRVYKSVIDEMKRFEIFLSIYLFVQLKKMTRVQQI